MNEPNSKHNIIANEREEVKKIEAEIAQTDGDVIKKRVAQGRILASLKLNTLGLEPPISWEQWVPENFGFTRKTADNFINLANWYVPHYEGGCADKEAHIASLKETGGKSEYRHEGFTSFTATLELLSKRARKMKALANPKKARNTKPKVLKPAKLSKKDKLACFHDWSAKLYSIVVKFDAKHPVLDEIDTSILFDGQEAPGGATADQPVSGATKQAQKGKKFTADPVGGDRLAAD